MIKKLLVLFTASLLASTTFAQIQLPALISNGMVLQRDTVVKIWGWASPNEKIAVQLNNRLYKTTADMKGNWQVQLPPMKAGGPYKMEISGKNKITLNDILFGDVWLCSGQSNMVHQMNIHDVLYAKDIKEANYPMIRQCRIPTLTSMQGPQNNLPPVEWQAAVGEQVRPFSAVAYFFAKKIYEKYKVPIGIINASVGGTPIEAWIGESGFKDFPSLEAILQKNKDTAYLKRINATTSVISTPPADAGLSGNPKWFDPLYIPQSWRNINIPGYWEDQGVKDLNGVVWYRKEVQIPANMASKPAKIHMGRIVDSDEMYVNGKLIGSTGYQYPQRRYNVPEGILKQGKNIFVIRVTNNAGKGGFVPDKPYYIFSGNDTVDLKGYWQYKVGLVNVPQMGMAGNINAQDQPAALFNAMVAPYTNYIIKGICWYQGESNAGKPGAYRQLMAALINNWRSCWNNSTLPFLFVQLPGFMDYNYLPSASNWALIREAQLQSLSLPHTGMAVAIDLGEWNDIHPDNKKDVGERLALAALKIAHGQNIVYSGPLYESAVIEGNKISIHFGHTGSGLATTDNEAPADFAIAGADKKFVWAKTRIEGHKIIVWSDEITDPKFVRYAWADNPVNPNLINKEGLPASPFRTDE